MKPVICVYVGWIPPEGKQWEPMYRTMRCSGGYQSDRTELYAPTVERYPGLEMTLSFFAKLLELPYVLERRTPLNCWKIMDGTLASSIYPIQTQMYLDRVEVAD
jgi:hypothetical protein